MRQFTAIDMLSIWEQGLNQSLLYRALVLLAATHPDLDPNEIAEWSIGQRDQALLVLRKKLFGSTLVNTCVCPECSEQIEWQNTVEEMLSTDEILHATDFKLKLDHYQVRFRLPNSLDIAAVVNLNSLTSAKSNLLKSCILECFSKGKKKSLTKLPKKVLAEVSKRIEELDSQAEITIDLSCPVCTHRWSVLFDISSFLWTELNAWAERTLQMVHTIAYAYGWTEQEILKLSPVRRQLYLGMLRS